MTPQYIEHLANHLAREAAPQLEQIALKATQRHDVHKIQLEQDDVQRLALMLMEVQQQSFLMGVYMGVEILKKVSGDLK